MPRVGVQDPARGKECWAQHRAVPSASHHSGSVEWLGVQAGVAAAGNATSCPYWPGVGSSHGGRAPWQGVLSVPWGQGVGGSGCTPRRNVGWEGPWFQLGHSGCSQQCTSSRHTAWPRNPKSSSSSR